MHCSRAIVISVLLCLPTTKARATEFTFSPQALVRDLEKIVVLQQHGGWKVDEYEFRDMLPVTMNSVCRFPRDGYHQVQKILDDRVVALGGDPRKRLQEPGQTTETIEELLTAWRTQQLFLRTKTELEHCPFWMKQDPDFRGLHSNEDRWSLSAEGGGLFLGRLSQDNFRIGGGGGGRFTVGYGFDPNWDLRTGIGFGGGGLADSSLEPKNVAVDFYLDAPIILRHSGLLWRQDIEISPVVTGIPWRDPLRYGARVGGMVGLAYLRVREVMPWIGLIAYAEYVFARAGLPDAWTFRIGTRFGFSWSPVED